MSLGDAASCNINSTPVNITMTRTARRLHIGLQPVSNCFWGPCCRPDRRSYAHSWDRFQCLASLHNAVHWTPVAWGLCRPDEGHEELRCVLAVIRHGDRTPKQKMKMKVTQVPPMSLLHVAHTTVVRSTAYSAETRLVTVIGQTEIGMRKTNQQQCKRSQALLLCRLPFWICCIGKWMAKASRQS